MSIDAPHLPPLTWDKRRPLCCRLGHRETDKRAGKRMRKSKSPALSYPKRLANQRLERLRAFSSSTTRHHQSPHSDRAKTKPTQSSTPGPVSDCCESLAKCLVREGVHGCSGGKKPQKNEVQRTSTCHGPVLAVFGSCIQREPSSRFHTAPLTTFELASYWRL